MVCFGCVLLDSNTLELWLGDVVDCICEALNTEVYGFHDPDEQFSVDTGGIWEIGVVTRDKFIILFC